VTTTSSGVAPPEPYPLTAWARQSFELRSLDSELAALVFDSHDDAYEEDVFGSGADRRPATMRRPPPSSERRLMFESGDEQLVLALTVTTSLRGRRLEGHIVPTGVVTVELRHASAPVAVPVEADPLGGFIVGHLEPGPIRVTFRRTGGRPVSSEWFLVD
jgi:hypothetical protein